MGFKMKIYLLRHAQSCANNLDYVCGHLDFPLSTHGHKQAAEISKKIDSIAFTKIFSSTLIRAISTIQYIQSGVPVVRCDELRECNNGYVSLLTLPILWEKDPRFEKPWLFPHLRYPGGESFFEMTNRIRSWFDRSMEEWQEDDVVLIVGHHGTVKTLYMHLLGMKLADYPDFELENCDCIFFEFTNGKVVNNTHIPFNMPQSKPLRLRVED